MSTYKYIEEGGQTYLQCKIEVKTYSGNHFVLTHVSPTLSVFSISVDTLYKIPSRGKGIYKQTKYKEVCKIVMN